MAEKIGPPTMTPLDGLSCSEGGSTRVMTYRRMVARRTKLFWRVRCSCGFMVYDLDTEEAADDTARWHLGLPSELGRWGGFYEPSAVTEGVKPCGCRWRSEMTATSGSYTEGSCEECRAALINRTYKEMTSVTR